MSYSGSPFAMFTMAVIIGLLSAVSPAIVASAQELPLQQVDSDEIDAYIRSRMQTASIPGLALGVVRSDGVVYLQGYGIAGPDGRAVTPQTPFILGSTSKSITALAVMQLVEAGKIDLDAPVTTYLPWFRTSDAAASAQITVRNLLYQDSGLPTYEGRLGFGDNDQSRMALENGIRDISSVQLRQPVGQGYEYANENYDILGLIVQTVSGNSYEGYVRSAIFAPLQMSHSAASLSDPAAIDIATGYRYWFLWPLPFDAPYPRRMTPSGFLISSAEDMTHYLIAQLNEGTYGNQQLLSPQGTVTLHTPGPLSSYGMGWVIQGDSGSTRIWHSGDTSNFHSNLLLLPDQQIGIVTLVNIGGFTNSSAVNIPIEGVAEILLGNGLSAGSNPPASLVLPVMLLAALLIVLLWIAGSYLSIRRWQHRGELPPHGVKRIWQFYLPLAIDLCPLILIWIIVPDQFRTPVQTMALFAPDVFVAIVTLTVLGLGWAILRSYFTLRPRLLMKHASS
ncbi:MAG: beta-lactamase family protein [Anaerolineae bacterium]|nr:beta-lactamase family protein [Anaerolineae bacterium]